jgi:hypothetical protein
MKVDGGREMGKFADDPVVMAARQRLDQIKTEMRDLNKVIDDADRAYTRLNQVACEKCGGEGWLWWFELDNYDGPAVTGPNDDTRYSCDGEAHVERKD